MVMELMRDHLGERRWSITWPGQDCWFKHFDSFENLIDGAKFSKLKAKEKRTTFETRTYEVYRSALNFAFMHFGLQFLRRQRHTLTSSCWKGAASKKWAAVRRHQICSTAIGRTGQWCSGTSLTAAGRHGERNKSSYWFLFPLIKLQKQNTHWC